MRIYFGIISQNWFQLKVDLRSVFLYKKREMCVVRLGFMGRRKFLWRSFCYLLPLKKRLYGRNKVELPDTGQLYECILLHLLTQDYVRGRTP